MPFIEKTTTLEAHPKVINCLMHTYGADENITDKEGEIFMFTEHQTNIRRNLLRN